MKKTFLFRLFLLLTGVLTLSACVDQTLNIPHQAAVPKTFVKTHKAAKVRIPKASPDKDGNYAISLNDFSDLNLPNDGETRTNIWGKLAEGFKITNPESHPEVQQQIRWFLNHPDYLKRTTERARPYMYIVYNEVKKRGLPTELVLLPINESGYYPFSYSTAGATGIWQLMPGTASNFGLKHDFWYDGRRDIFDSTNAALDYLTYLANYFNNDWLIAIAAYDTGEGNVQNAIARNVRDGLPTDFWSLKLPAETRAYVPRLLAIAAIIEHPDRYPVPLPAIEDKPVVAQVRLTRQMKITDVARLSGLSVNQVKVLNPGLSRFATDPGLDAKVLLPIDSIDDFQQSLKNGSENFTPNETINLDQANLVIPNKATASAVVLHHEVANVATSTASQARVITANQPPSVNRVKQSNKVAVDNEPEEDESVSIPKKHPSTTTHKKVTVKATHPHTDIIKHKIKAGETLSSIATKNQVTVKQLQHLNPTLTKSPLKVGTVIILKTA